MKNKGKQDGKDGYNVYITNKNQLPMFELQWLIEVIQFITMLNLVDLHLCAIE
jgi:hypothetical protein